jgi:PAS domain S-box-containing protein
MRPLHNVLIGRGFRPFVARLTHGVAGGLLIAAVFFLLLGSVNFFQPWRDGSYFYSGTIGPLTEEFEETKGGYKGLEAFVLSGLDKEVGNTLEHTYVTGGFVTAFNQLQDDINPQPQPGDGRRPETQRAVNSAQQEAALKPEAIPRLTVVPPQEPGLRPQNITEKFITNDSGEGFLFIPGMVVGTFVPAYAGDKQIIEEVTRLIEVRKTDAATGKDVVRQVPSVMRSNVADSEKAARYLKELMGIRVLGEHELSEEQSVVWPRPVQSYFLSATGLLRLERAGATNIRRDYEPRFISKSFFPDRPYFWRTVDDPAHKGRLDPAHQYKITDVFRKTKPYIDFGGNGIVVTLSRTVDGAAVKSGLFLDFALRDYAENIIKQKIRRLGGSSPKVFWRVENGKVVVTREDNSLSERKRAALEGQMQVPYKEKRLSDIVGKLFLPVQSAEDRGKDGKVVFTVPVSDGEPPGLNAAGTQLSHGALLYCEMDLDDFQSRSLSKAYVAAGSLVAFVFCTVLLGVVYHWRSQEQEAESRRRLEEQKVDYARRLEEQKKALESFSQIMSRATVAYCHLSEDDVFVELNEAFADLLGYESPGAARESLVNKQTFESLLADDESRQEYAYIRDKRRSSLQTTPYRVKLCGKYRDVDVSVYGASVPMPKSHPEAVPQTFGILEEVGESHRVMSVTPVLGLPKKPSERGDLFVLMKFAREFDEVYKSIIDVGQRLSLVATRADQVLTAGDVMDDVWASIYAADLIIADCTGLNPNVFYEIGLAHVLGKPVVFLTQNDKDFPFDVARFRRIPYNLKTGQGLKKFEADLEQMIKSELGLGAK